MTVRFEDLENMEPMYSFVGDDGENIHIASGLLYDWVQRNKPNLEIVLTPVDSVRAVSYIRDNVVSRARCKHLLSYLHKEEEYEFQPMIYGESGTHTRNLPDLYHIDGHHRYVCYAYIGRPFATSYILEQHQWRPFQITGVPDITKEELNRMPVRPRSYEP